MRATLDAHPLVGMIFRKIRSGHEVVTNILACRHDTSHSATASATPILVRCLFRSAFLIEFLLLTRSAGRGLSKPRVPSDAAIRDLRYQSLVMRRVVCVRIRREFSVPVSSQEV